MFSKIYLEITNVCNLSCSFCVGTKRKKHFMTAEEFEFLAKSIRSYTNFLYFHLMGEPTLHPKLERFLEIAKDLGFKVIITTNGTMLKQVQDILLNSNVLFKVNISLHSFEANSGVNEDEYFNNCIDFADKASEKDIVTVFRLWNDGGENTLNSKIIGVLKAKFQEEWVENTRGFRIRKKLFIENGEKFEWPMYAENETENIVCYGMKDHIGVLCDGSVVPCCLDYDGKLSFGNLFTDTLENILASSEAVSFKNALMQRKAPCEMCKKCGFVQKKILHIQ